MLPSIYSENLFDDFFSDPFDMVMPRSLNALYGKHGKNLMKTDVRETEDTYELDKEEPEKKGKYIRQERYAGACSRNFYVGEHVEPEDIRAKFENGILQISLPKAAKKQLPKSNVIAIE